VSASIVCGVDGSRNAAGAVVFAGRLSELLGRRLVLVNVKKVPLVPGASALPHAYDDLRNHAVADASDVLERVCEELGLADSVERKVRLGHPVEALIAVCDEEEADLLVVGSRGLGRIRSALVGSVSAAVAAQAPCPVAVVPPRASLSAIAVDSLQRSPRRAPTMPTRRGDTSRA